jgi:ABC-type transporter Mla MlaB component
LAYRIQRLAEPGVIVFVLSGELDPDHSIRLGELIGAEEPGRVQVDLKDLTLVDRAGVQFLARLQAQGIALVNCPGYITRWIAAEEDS